MTKEELEKEAMAKYKTGSYPQVHPDHWAFVHGHLAGAEPREKRIAELEKENAELRITTVALENANKAMSKELDDMTSGGISVLKNVVRSKEQLTQAKELLKKIEKIVYNGENEIKRLSKIVDILAEAEQFLKEK